ncbi:MAG: DUF1549 and DUF1553 domain-containing protein [Planctomycetota bacterium]|nr:DUF1549 and DUF1553 domain-containing protein [Planctomycetota bacterium]
MNRSVLFPCVALLVVCGFPLVVHGEELRDSIDHQLAAAWKANGIEPAKPSSDGEFLRRVHLDLLGTIPTHDEAVAFLDDTRADKRKLLIDRLLNDPRFAEHQGEVWDMVLFGRNPPGYGTDKRDEFQAWLRDQFAKNTPYDQWVKAILRAEGNTIDNGAPMYFVQYRNEPEEATQAVTQTFLGVQLQCARCHDHPFEPWTQLDFYGTAAFFARLRVVDIGKKNKLTMYAIGERNTGDVLFTGPTAEQVVGKKGEPVKPKFLQGEPLVEPELSADFKEDRNFPNGKVPPSPKFSRKNQLADWIARPGNPYFARAVANRIWAQFMGRGIVHPVDNMSRSNTPSHPELLDQLARNMVDHKFDLKWYIRELVNSRAYQLSGSGPVEAAMPQWFEQARTRPLSAEELLDAWKVAIGWDGIEKSSGKKASEDRYSPLGSGYLVQFLGRPNNGVGDFQGGLHEHLFLNNGGIGSLLSQSKGGLHHSLLNSKAPWTERVDQLYLAMLSRRPVKDEQERFVEFLSAEENSSGRLQEAIWVLMTCSEFRFNH